MASETDKFLFYEYFITAWLFKQCLSQFSQIFIFLTFPFFPIYVFFSTMSLLLKQDHSEKTKQNQKKKIHQNPKFRIKTVFLQELIFKFSSTVCIIVLGACWWVVIIRQYFIYQTQTRELAPLIILWNEASVSQISII